MKIGTSMLLRFLVLTSLIASGTGYAAQFLDSTFGQGIGYVTTSNSLGCIFSAMAFQSDGKIIAAGQTQSPNTQGILVRYNPDGSIDTTFGTNGIVTLQNGDQLSTTYFNGVAVQSDGQIVTVGDFFDPNTASNILVCRFNTNGTLDTTFGSGGIATLFVGSGCSGNAIVIQPNQEIVIAGNAVVSGTPNVLLALLDSSGALDTGFASAGIFTNDVGGASGDFFAVTLDSFGNILGAGLSNGSLLIMRCTSSGSLDTSFNSTGFVTDSLGNIFTSVNAIALDASGNIVVGGSTVVVASQYLVARYTSSGARDISFNSTGFVTQQLGGGANIEGIAIQSNGDIMAAGIINCVINESFFVRLTTSGSLDTSFGPNGGLNSLIIGNGSQINAIGLQSSDGRMVAVGQETSQLSNLQSGLVLRTNLNNSDFISITSITTDSINTKIPTISGTSSAGAGAQVAVSINGSLFNTVTTDSLGNWNAGTSPVLTPGNNRIQADLIVGSVLLVSEEIDIDVIDNLGEDAVYAYSNATQNITAPADTFQAVSFSSAPILNTWTFDGTSTFTCHQAGKYLIHYTGQPSLSTFVLTGSPIVVTESMIVSVNGTEVTASEANTTVDTAGTAARALTNKAVVNLNVNDQVTISVAYIVVSGTPVSGTPALVANSNSDGVTKSSASLAIVRLQ